MNKDAVCDLITEQSPLGLLLTDGAQRNAFWINARFTELFGYELFEIPLADGWLKLPGSAKARDSTPAKSPDDGAGEKAKRPCHPPVRLRLACKDGSVRHVECTFSEASGGCLFIFADEKALREQVEAEREQEFYFEQLVEESPDAVVVFDVDANRFLYANACAERLFGCSREGLLKAGPQRFYCPEQPDHEPVAQTFASHNAEALAGNKPVFERSIRSADGREAVCQVRLTRLPSPSDRKLIRASFTNITEQTQMREALLKSQRLLNEAERLSHTAAWEWDLVADRWTFSKAWAVITGADELAGRSVKTAELLKMKLAHKLDHGVFLRAISKARKGKLQRLEFRIRHKKTGEVRRLVTIAEAIRDVGGKPLKIYGAAQDVTEICKAEEAQARLAAIVENSTDAILSETLDGRIVTWNRGAKEMFGYEAEEIVGRPALMLIPPALRSNYMTTLARVGRGEHVLTYESQGVAKDGRILDVSVTFSPVKDRLGNVIAGAKILRDITRRKAAEAALQASEIKHRIVADNTYDWEFWRSPEGEFIYCSPSCQRITGYSAAEFLADPELLLRIVDAADREEVSRYIEKTKAPFPAGEFEFRVRRPDGGIRWVAQAFQPVYGEAGEFLGTRGSNRDITQRKRAQEDALRYSSERLALAQQVGKIGSFEWNIENSTTIWAKELEALYGLRPGELGTFDDWVRRIYTEDRAEVVRELRKAQESGEFAKEFRIVWPDESIHWIQARGRIFYDDAQQPVRMIGVNIDVTERKRVEEALRRSAEDLKEAQRLARVGSWEWSIKPDVVTFSDEAYRLEGCDPALPAPSYEEHRKLYTEETFAQMDAKVHNTLRTGEPFEGELELKNQTPDGTRWNFLRGEALKDAAGQVIKLRGTIQDITERKATEAMIDKYQRELVAKNQQLQALFEHAPAAITLLDAQPPYMVLAHNRLSAQALRLQDMTGESILECIPESERAGIAAVLDKVCATKKEVSVYNFPFNSGFDVSWWTWNASPVISEGRLVALAVVSVEVSREVKAREALEAEIAIRKRAEEAKERLLRQHQAVLASIDEGVVISDLDGKVLLMNRAAVQMFGFASEEEAQRTPREAFKCMDVHGNVLEPSERPLDRAIRGENFSEEEYCITRTDSSLSRLFSISGTSVYDHQNRQILAVLTMRDITKRKQVELQRQAYSERLALATEAAQMGVWEWDISEKKMLWDERMYEIFGMPQGEEVDYETWAELVLPEDWPQAEAKLHNFLAKQTQGMVEFRIKRADDGRIRYIQSSFRASYDKNGKLLRVAGINFDITDRKLAEENLRTACIEAETANRAKDQFLAVLSHELRTPLTPVLATITEMESQRDLSPEARADLELIHRNVDLESRLIDDLLDITRISRKKVKLALEAVDVHLSLRTTLEICQRDVAAKEIALSLRLQAIRHYVWADPTRLRQVFWNVLNNAIKFTPSGGSISVATFNSDESLRIEFRDTGVGIEAEAMPKIFDAFEQGEQTKARRFGGLGLGLSIAKAVMDMHHGTITAFSEGKDQGTKFVIELETISEPEPSTAAPSAHTPVGGSNRPKILLVEDNPDTLRVLCKLLTKWTYDVSCTSSVSQAIQAAAQEQFDLIISDLGLPDGSGLDVMRELKHRYGLHGIALSGYGTEEDIRLSREAGFEQHLVKPVSFQLLQAAIDQLTLSTVS